MNVVFWILLGIVCRNGIRMMIVVGRVNVICGRMILLSEFISLRLWMMMYSGVIVMVSGNMSFVVKNV